MKIRRSKRSCWRLRRILWRDGLWPHAHQYLAAMPRMVRAFGGKAFSNGSAFCTDDYAGAALWLPPGVHPDEEELGAVIESTVAPSLAAETAAIFEQMATYHPTEPHWYLPLIGVDPAHQGEGHGEALDGVRTRAVRSRSRAGLFGILEPAQHSVLPAPRLRTARRDPGGFVADARPDAAATALNLSESRRLSLCTRSWLGAAAAMNRHLLVFEV